MRTKKKGRPTKYRVEFDVQARKLCLLGSTDEGLADFFEVAISSIYEWKINQPTFSDAIKEGKKLADANVGEALYQRATGYSCPDTHVAIYKGKAITTEVIKHYPPSEVACIYWLNNRSKLNWSNKSIVELKEYSKTPTDELNRRVENLMKKKNEDKVNPPPVH